MLFDDVTCLESELWGWVLKKTGIIYTKDLQKKEFDSKLCIISKRCEAEQEASEDSSEVGQN